MYSIARFANPDSAYLRNQVDYFEPPCLAALLLGGSKPLLLVRPGLVKLGHDLRDDPLLLLEAGKVSGGKRPGIAGQVIGVLCDTTAEMVSQAAATTLPQRRRGCSPCPTTP